MQFGRIVRGVGMGGAALALACLPGPVLAQDDDAQARIRKLEGEVRALQRKVFPGGDGRYFEPQITGQPAAPATVTTPSTTAVTDILARLDALEGQIQRLTAQSEESANAIRILSERLNAYESGAKSNDAIDRNLSTMTGTPPAERIIDPAPTPTPTNATAPRQAAAATGGTGPSAARLAAVQAIAKPQTDDAADDEYSYGFRLWEAGFYPEAQQQLTMYVEEHPNHWRATYGRNLLGRAYLDDGKAREAAPWFLKNYQSDKTGERAGDSLLYLAEAMIAMKDTNRACIALAEFSETYPALAAGRLQAQYVANRAKVTCD